MYDLHIYIEICIIVGGKGGVIEVDIRQHRYIYDVTYAYGGPQFGYSDAIIIIASLLT